MKAEKLRNHLKGEEADMNGITSLDPDPAWNSDIGACCTILGSPAARPRICSTDTSKIDAPLRGMLR